MIQKHVTRPIRNTRSKDLSTSGAQLTIFSIPKKFDGHDGVIQRNAIRSWASVGPSVQIVLFGQDDPELDKIAQEVHAHVVPIEANEHGTPRLNFAFQFVSENFEASSYCYANCDIIFGTELFDVVEELGEVRNGSYLAIGQRINCDVVDELDVFDSQQLAGLRRDGNLDSIVCKDFFVFPPDLYREIPAFLVGRGNWDNWMVAHAKDMGTPVIDLTDRLPAIHQNHDYHHVAGGRRQVYISGAEAKENQRLGGGRNLVSGSTANWKLTENGLKKRWFPWLAVLRDLPRFLSLLRNLMILGYMHALSALTL